MLTKLLSTLALSSVALMAHAHGKLDLATPAPNSTLDSAPKEIRLKFNENFEAAFSSITVGAADGHALATAKATADRADPKTMVLALPALNAGTYAVHWAVMTRDGHKTKGDYSFRVK